MYHPPPPTEDPDRERDARIAKMFFLTVFGAIVLFYCYLALRANIDVFQANATPALPLPTPTP